MGRSQNPILLKGHTNDITCVEVSPNGKYIATGSWDETVNLYFNDSIPSLFTTIAGHEGAVTCINFSRNGKNIATGGQDGQVIIWEIVENGFGPPILDKVAEYKAHKSAVSKIIYGPALKMVYSSGLDGKMVSYFIAKKKKRELKTKKEISSFAISADRNYFFIVHGAEIKQIDLTGKVLRTISGHKDDITDIIYTLDRQYLVTSSKDKTIIIWKIGKGKIYKTLNQHKWAVSDIAITSNGQYLASSSIDGTAIIWDFKQAKSLNTIKSKYKCTAINFSPNASQIVIGLHTLENNEDYGANIHTTGLKIKMKRYREVLATKKTSTSEKSKEGSTKSKKSGSSTTIINTAAAAKKSKKVADKGEEKKKELIKHTNEVIITIEDE